MNHRIMCRLRGSAPRPCNQAPRPADPLAGVWRARACLAAAPPRASAAWLQAAARLRPPVLQGLAAPRLVLLAWAAARRRRCRAWPPYAVARPPLGFRAGGREGPKGVGRHSTSRQELGAMADGEGWGLGRESRVGPLIGPGELKEVVY